MLENLVKYLIGHKEKSTAYQLIETLGKHAWQFQEYDDLAKTMFKIKDYKKSIEFGELALTTAYTNEQLWAARSNLINVYNHANEPEKAFRLIKLCESVKPGDIDILLEKAFSHFLINEKDQAEQILTKVLQETENLSEEYITKIKFNLGTYLLYRDQFQEGMRLFLFEGQKLDYWQKAKLPFKFWEGGIRPGKNIILFAEAGIGDELINIRFMHHLKTYGMNPIWLTDRKDLKEIFTDNNYKTISHIKELDKTKQYYWTYPMSLPVYLNLQFKDLWKGPYLKNYYITSLVDSSSRKLKIGLRWQGNPEYDQDLHRTIPLHKIIPLVDNNQTDLYSLQRDTGLEDLIPFTQVKDLSQKLPTFKDTLAVIDALDVIITSCTSIAHAAAALGKRTFIFVPISAYYLYCNTWGERTPWYGENVTILRQVKNKCWESPINRLNEILQTEFFNQTTSEK